MVNPLRNLPSVSQLLESAPIKRLIEGVNQNVVVDRVRDFLDDFRGKVSQSVQDLEIPNPSELAEQIAQWIQAKHDIQLRPVINATGIILHTGLGRAPLSAAALAAVEHTAGDYCNVEINLETGERSQRAELIREAIRSLTGAEDVAVANNNAAATMLALAAVAKGREVIVSRGELVEIGGSYRLPDVIECSGCRLREVGTTNKTRLSDYEQAINDNTGAILRVHPSNYQIVGFTDAPSLADLVRLGHQRQIPVIDDVGSGALVDFSKYGLLHEPVIRDRIATGADLVLFSGDKLIGGPQCGLIVGKQRWIKQVLANPLMRAMRVGKLTLAALSATLDLYLKPDSVEQGLPVLSMLATPLENLHLRAKKLADQLSTLSWLETAEVLQDEAMLGGGSMPNQALPTWCVVLQPKTLSVDQLARQLRLGNPAVLGRIQKNRLWLDLRTVHPRFDIALVDRLESIK